MLLARHMHIIKYEPVGLKFLMMVSVLMLIQVFLINISAKPIRSVWEQKMGKYIAWLELK